MIAPPHTSGNACFNCVFFVAASCTGEAADGVAGVFVGAAQDRARGWDSDRPT